MNRSPMKRRSSARSRVSEQPWFNRMLRRVQRGDAVQIGSAEGKSVTEESRNAALAALHRSTAASAITTTTRKTSDCPLRSGCPPMSNQRAIQ